MSQDNCHFAIRFLKRIVRVSVCTMKIEETENAENQNKDSFDTRCRYDSIVGTIAEL